MGARQGAPFFVYERGSMLTFYDVSPSYLDYLRSIDERVPRNDYETHKKFMCGIFVMINGRSYLVPVSSKFGKAREFRIHERLPDGTRRTISSLRFSYMIPVPKEHMKKRIINDEQDRKYRRLLITEHEYINRYEKLIRARALEVYEAAKDPQSADGKYCCDFARLEREATAEGYQRFLEERQAGVEAESVPTAAPAAAATEAAPEGTPAAAGRQSSPELLAMVSGMQDPVVPGAGNVPQASKGKENINE